MRTLGAILACAALAACASNPGPTRSQRDRIERVLATSPGQAQPSKIVATEIAFSRAAREKGQWSAFAEYAASGAVIHGRDGPIGAAPWLASQDDPKAAVQWTPLAVWMSCDGQLAVSQGKFAEPGGNWGYYVTVWERQSDGSYRWTYDMGAPDPMLTERENREREPVIGDENAIVVEAIPMVQGDFAQCARGSGKPQPLATSIETDARTGGTVSRDGSLSWQWLHYGDGRRAFSASLWKAGSWEEALRFDITPEGQVAPR